MNRKNLIRLVTFLGGIYFFLRFVLPESVAGVRLSDAHDEFTLGLTTVAAMAFGLGLISIGMVHGGRVLFRRTGWGASTALLLGLIAMLTVSALDWRSSVRAQAPSEAVFHLRSFAEVIVRDDVAQRTDVPPFGERVVALARSLRSLPEELVPSGINEENLRANLFPLAEKLEMGSDPDRRVLLPQVAQELSTVGVKLLDEMQAIESEVLSKKLYQVLFQGLFVPLGGAMFALLGFYIASAAYRAFRIRSLDAALLMLTALVVMLGQIPFGIWLWEGFPEVRLWLLTVPSSAARRAIEIGAAVAGLILAFRMWLSIESDTFSKGGRS